MLLVSHIRIFAKLKVTGFYNLGFSFGSIIHLGLVLLYGVRYDSKGCVCVCVQTDVQFSRLFVEKNNPFSTHYFSPFVENQWSVWVYFYISLNSVGLVYLFLCKYFKLLPSLYGNSWGQVINNKSANFALLQSPFGSKILCIFPHEFWNQLHDLFQKP